MTTTGIDYPFTQEQAEAAHAEWGCNCGPAALAFALQTKLENVRHAIPDFESKRYTSPTMMKQALAKLGVTYTECRATHATMTGEPEIMPRLRLVRIQWLGPWTAPGVNPKWAYHYTHWICAWNTILKPLIFDINGGVNTVFGWEQETVPLITKSISRADGGWKPTHVWRVERGK